VTKAPGPGDFATAGYGCLPGALNKKSPINFIEPSLGKGCSSIWDAFFKSAVGRQPGSELREFRKIMQHFGPTGKT
jgi:hypothetical protein